MFTWEITTNPFFTPAVIAAVGALFFMCATVLEKNLRLLWGVLVCIALVPTGLIEKHETGEFSVMEVSATTNNQDADAPTFKDTTLLCFKEDDLTSCFPYNKETGEYDEEFAVEIFERAYPTTFEVLPELTITESGK